MLIKRKLLIGYLNKRQLIKRYLLVCLKYESKYKSQEDIGKETIRDKEAWNNNDNILEDTINNLKYLSDLQAKLIIKIKKRSKPQKLPRTLDVANIILEKIVDLIIQIVVMIQR